MRMFLRALLICFQNSERRHCSVVVKSDNSTRSLRVCITLGNLLNHFLPQFPYSLYADSNSIHHIGLLNALICLKFLGQYLAHVSVVSYYYNYFYILVFSL